MFGVVICAVCAAAGRNSLFDIFLNFLAFMGYWVSMWLTIQLLDEFLFRKLLGMPHHGYRWEEWNSQEKLPLGLAALVSFLIGFVGAVLCMYQAWFIGPLAKGAYGDVSFPSASMGQLFSWC